VNFATLKIVHITAVALSLTGFAMRGAGVLSGASWVRHPLARTLPHGVDTVLLLTGLGMLWMIHVEPWATPWLRAKIIGLVVYIGLGLVALRPTRPGHPHRPHATRLAAWLAALAVGGYIVSVALTKSPLGALNSILLH
jgi:uncharacterized membrane protein SirB2